MFVHGLFADGSCWTRVIARLQAARPPARPPCKDPLTTLPEAVASTPTGAGATGWSDGSSRAFLSGMIVTEAGVHPNVSALVYVAARGLRRRVRTTRRWQSDFPALPAAASIIFDGDEGRLSKKAFLQDFMRRSAGSESRRCYTWSRAVPEGPAHRQDNTHPAWRSEPKLLRGLNGRPHDQYPTWQAFNGEADRRQDDRGELKPSFTESPHPDEITQLIIEAIGQQA